MIARSPRVARRLADDVIQEPGVEARSGAERDRLCGGRNVDARQELVYHLDSAAREKDTRSVHQFKTWSVCSRGGWKRGQK